MYTKEQEARALEEYEKTGFVSEVIRRLGYSASASNTITDLPDSRRLVRMSFNR